MLSQRSPIRIARNALSNHRCSIPLIAILCGCLLPTSSRGGIVAYYSFDSDFTDQVGSNNLTADAGTPTITSAGSEVKFGGGALSLDYSSDLNLGTNITFGATDAWSVSFWGKRASGSDNRSGMVLGTTNGFIWTPDNSSVVQGLRYRNSGDSDFGGFSDDGEFHHWVVIANGAGSVEVYRDNVSLGTQSNTSAVTFDEVGTGAGTANRYHGSIDELYIFDEAIDAAKVAELFNGGGVVSGDPSLKTIVDDQSAGSVVVGALITYTLTFSEDIDESTVEAGDFGNAGSASITFGSITEVSPGIFEVEITPQTTGTLQFQVNQFAAITDFAGNPLDTSSAIIATDSITVQEEFNSTAVKHIRVYLLGGQSNADGRANPSDLPTNPINLQQPQDDVDFYEGSLTTLRPLGGQFGPEITWGRCLADNLADGITTRVAIIKHAAGGTSLEEDWKPGGDATTTNDGSRYVSFQNVVHSGISALAAAYPNAVIRIEGMLFVQGERDAKGGFENNYETNLNNFIADVRLTYGSELLFIISRLSIDQTNISAVPLEIVRAAQTAAAAADPLAALVDTDGFGMSGDNLHFNATGQQQIGEASCTQTLNFYPFMRQPRFLQDSGGNFSIRVDEAFNGFLFTLQFREALDSGEWTSGEAKTASDNTVDFTVTPSGSKSFYRVVRTLAP